MLLMYSQCKISIPPEPLMISDCDYYFISGISFWLMTKKKLKTLTAPGGQVIHPLTYTLEEMASRAVWQMFFLKGNFTDFLLVSNNCIAGCNLYSIGQNSPPASYLLQSLLPRIIPVYCAVEGTLRTIPLYEADGKGSWAGLLWI